MTKPSTQRSSDTATEHFFELLKKFDSATLVTRVPDGSLHGRPLNIAGKEEDGTLWFMTSRQSMKVEEILADRHALVAMQNSRQFIVCHGSAFVVDDRAKVHELWSEAQRVWFKGEDDPDITLVCFKPVEAEFWDNAGVLGAKFAFEAAKAILKGQPLRDRSDDRAHGRVPF